jgi:hypothetical protein
MTRPPRPDDDRVGSTSSKDLDPAEIRKQIQERRADAEFTDRLRRIHEDNREILDRLGD